MASSRARLFGHVPRGHRERLLPLREVEARPLTTVGIGRAGISSSPAGYEIGSPARVTHKLFVTLKGRGFVATDERKLPLSPGTLAFVPAGTACRYGTDGRRWTRLWLNLADIPHWGEVARRGPGVDRTDFGRRLELAMEGMLAELGAAQPVLPDPGTQSRASFDSERAYLESQLGDRYGWAYPPAPAPATHREAPATLYARLLRAHVHDMLRVADDLGRDHQGARLDRLWARVRDSLDTGWTTESLASTLGVSVATLHRMTRERYARTPGSMLGQLRMEQAKRLLSLTDEPVKAIAARLGYSSPFAFSNAFKKRTGLSPQAYRGNA